MIFYTELLGYVVGTIFQGSQINCSLIEKMFIFAKKK